LAVGVYTKRDGDALAVTNDPQARQKIIAMCATFGESLEALAIGDDAIDKARRRRGDPAGECNELLNGVEFWSKASGAKRIV